MTRLDVMLVLVPLLPVLLGVVAPLAPRSRRVALRLFATFSGFVVFASVFSFVSMSARVVPACSYILSGTSTAETNPWWVYRPGPPWVCDNLGDINLVAVIGTGLAIAAIQLLGYVLVSRTTLRRRQIVAA